jgi:hypothetical protein
LFSSICWSTTVVPVTWIPRRRRTFSTWYRYRITPTGRQIITAILAAHDASLQQLNDPAAAA